jgi:predicted DNA-binding transcriptional regulator YafY
VSRPASTLQRLERILTMVPWLLDHPGASVEEVTARFGLSRDELSSDLDILGYCGLPGYGGGDLVEAWIVGDRVTVRMADFFSRPLRLSLREALTLLLAARALSGVAAFPESPALATAERKLTDLLGASVAEAPVRRERDDEPVSPRIAVDLRAQGDEHLPALREAVVEGRVVRITYRSASKAEVTRREVEPWGLSGSLGSWYLQGYCRLVQGPRDFRLDRIRDLEVTDEVTDAGERPALPPPAYQPAEHHEQVVLDLDVRAWWVAEWAVVEDATDRGDVRRVTLRTGEREWIARLVLGLGDAVRVVEPPELTEAVAALARRTLARYRAGDGP